MNNQFLKKDMLYKISKSIIMGLFFSGTIFSTAFGPGLSIETMPWLFCFLRQQLRRFVVLIEVVEDVKVDDDFWQPNTYPDEAHKRNPEGLLCLELGCRSSLYVVQ